MIGAGQKRTGQRLEGIPSQDGYHMPGEFEPHQGCIIIWPERPGSWGKDPKAARRAFCRVIEAVAYSEMVYVAAGKRGISSALEMLFLGRAVRYENECVYRYQEGEEKENGIAEHNENWRSNVEIFEAETDDAWARDISPTFVVKRMINRNGENETRVRAVNWEFNAWGGEVDGLYASWEKDQAFAALFAEKYHFDYYDAAPFVLEGGSIHSDGEGTLLVTEACLLSAGRNPGLKKEEIERRLMQYLDATKVLWLPRGIYGDETNEHVDNVCAFLRPGEVVLAWTDCMEDPQYELCRQNLSYLLSERDAKGRKLVIHKLPVPDVPVCITGENLDAYTFEAGEAIRENGERLAASYVNFYFSNAAVVMPVFGGENEESDSRAVAVMEKLVTDRRVIPVAARDILMGGGNIHCITQQIPV